MKIQFKKIFLSFAVIASFISYALFSRFGPLKARQGTEIPNISGAGDKNIASSDGSQKLVDPSSTSTIPSKPAVPAAPTVPPNKPILGQAPSSSAMKEGVYTGVSADAYYGNVQVKAVIRGGKLTDVQLASYPNDNQTSVLINNQALPILKSEAIKAQSDKINAVSGATYTSYAYITSLSSALIKARGGTSSGTTAKKPSQPIPPAAAPLPSPKTDPGITANAKFLDGQYAGDAVDAYYGNVQVKAVIQGGKLADVQLADYPKDNQTSVLINNQALQILKSEAIRAQSDQINAVSGATYTSYAYITSLSSALAKARGNASSPGVTVKNLPKPQPPATLPVPSAPIVTPQPGNTTNAKFLDGQYTGAVADAYYGNVQVKAVIQGGQITDVQFLSYPQDRQTSVLINNQATPILRSEAIQAQSAQINAVSGATYTSYAFMQSLTSALNQALAQPLSPTQPQQTLPPAPQMPPPNRGDNEDD